ncbi:MAG: tRNA(Ile)-lysidine synthetase, partial [Betaproteobacteria bacterium]|nr:tRNA(Ile)-lysidine synthetase [Betaproteobacteria bacterium]
RPSTVQLQELLAQLADCTTRGHRIDIRVGTGWVLRDGPLLHYEPAGPQAKPHL